MVKHELLKEYNRLCEAVGTNIDGIGQNSNNADIQNAIDCLNCSSGQLDEYMTVLKLKYPNIYNTVSQNGNWKLHGYNRLYVYNTARNILL